MHTCSVRKPGRSGELPTEAVGRTCLYLYPKSREVVSFYIRRSIAQLRSACSFRGSRGLEEKHVKNSRKDVGVRNSAGDILHQA